MAPAWPKLPPEKQTDLAQRYYENRLKYLVKTGEAAEAAEKLARADAEALGKGYYIPHVIDAERRRGPVGPRPAVQCV